MTCMRVSNSPLTSSFLSFSHDISQEHFDFRGVSGWHILNMWAGHLLLFPPLIIFYHFPCLLLPCLTFFHSFVLRLLVNCSPFFLIFSLYSLLCSYQSSLLLLTSTFLVFLSSFFFYLSCMSSFSRLYCQCFFFSPLAFLFISAFSLLYSSFIWSRLICCSFFSALLLFHETWRLANSSASDSQHEWDDMDASVPAMFCLV